jgi:hypothetical protein
MSPEELRKLDTFDRVAGARLFKTIAQLRRGLQL